MVVPTASQAVIVRCDGGAAFGMGHVSRGLALADELRGQHACDVTFAMREPDSAGVAAVRSLGYAVDPVEAAVDADYGNALAALVERRAATVIVVDVRDVLSREALDALRRSGVRVVVIDDPSNRRLAADLAFYPPAPQVQEMNWAGFTGRWFSGWEWVLLRREFAGSGLRPVESGGSVGSDLWPVGSDVAGGEGAQSTAIDVLITMGGSDPAGMTAFTVDALNLLPMPLAVEVLTGPAFLRPKELIGAVARSTHCVRVTQAPTAMAPLMRASRIAVSSFGVSAYELAACGVPSVHVGLTPDHARSSSAFDREGIAITAGVFAEIQPRDIADAAARLIGDAGLRMRMASRARELVDGRGASRIAQLMIDRGAGATA